MKSIDEVLQPDPYWVSSVCLDKITGEFRPCQFSDFYASLPDLTLDEAVPEHIRREFDAACHTFIYAWLSYDLATVGEHYAYAVLEMALRERLSVSEKPPRARDGMKDLLKAAFKRGFLNEKDYEFRTMPDGPPLCHLRDGVVRSRNGLSHGQIHRFIQGSEMALELCRDVINKLFAA